MSDTLVNDHQLTPNDYHSELDAQSPDQNLNMDSNSIGKAAVEKCKSFHF